MKGARGLLISITGGKDLTLFEVDEAATRIREEVDQDANIIVGATFDETPRRRHPRLRRCHRHRTGADRAQRARRRRAVVTNAVGRDAGQPAGRSHRPPARRQPAPGRARPEARGAAPCSRPRLRAGSRRSAAAHGQQRRACRARRDCRGGRSGSCRRPGAAAARLLWRRHGSPDRAEADPVPGSRRRPRRDRRAGDARDLHPAGGGTSAGPRPADAEVRGPSDAGPGRNPAGPRRGRGRASAEDPAVAAAAPGQCRPRPPRRRDRAADRGPRLRSGDGAAAASERKPQRSVAQQMARMSRYPSMPGVPHRKVWTSMAARHLLPRRHRATTILISRPSCAGRPTEVCYNSGDRKGPGGSRRGLFLVRATAVAVRHQATDIK